ncbi:MAG: ABC transporter permease [Desulfuromonadales bacterium]|nr:ABC transporter permease [Desulfuromonadales bacterium]
MNGFWVVLIAALRGFLRDRVLHALLGFALLLLVLAPVFSLFSMRQVQELSTTVALSAISLTLLVLAVMLGGFSVWRDVERRYTASVLGLPIPRSSYLLGKFAAVAVVLMSTSIFLGFVSLVSVHIAASFYPPDRSLDLMNFMAAIAACSLKYILLSAFALLFSSLSTSFFLPVFGSLAVYLAGGATQEVVEYVTGPSAQSLSNSLITTVKGLYYLLPNFAAFDLSFQAIYGIPLSVEGLLLTFGYFLVYTSLLLLLACYCLARREFP